MTEQFDEVLVQQYVAGREFNVGFVGSRTLAIAEIDFAGMPEGAWPILTHAAKWDRGSPEDLGSVPVCPANIPQRLAGRSEEHTSELQSHHDLVCRLLLEKKNKNGVESTQTNNMNTHSTSTVRLTRSDET